MAFRAFFALGDVQAFTYCSCHVVFFPHSSLHIIFLWIIFLVVIRGSREPLLVVMIIPKSTYLLVGNVLNGHLIAHMLAYHFLSQFILLQLKLILRVNIETYFNVDMYVDWYVGEKLEMIIFKNIPIPFRFNLKTLDVFVFFISRIRQHYNFCLNGNTLFW